MASSKVEAAPLPSPPAAMLNPVLTTAPHQWTTNMTASSLTSASGNSCLDEQIERLKRCEYLREGEVKALCLRAREILVDESNVQRVDAPVTVRTLCGNSCTSQAHTRSVRGSLESRVSLHVYPILIRPLS
jgi:hypothetical protein